MHISLNQHNINHLVGDLDLKKIKMENLDLLEQEKKDLNKEKVKAFKTNWIDNQKTIRMVEKLAAIEVY